MDAKEFFGDWSEVIDFDILNNTLNQLGVIMQTKSIEPAPENLFRAFRCCPYSDLRLIITSYDPYPQKGIATGIAFGNRKDTPLSSFSPSLKILYDAVLKYCSYDLPFSTIDEVFPTLESWCKQGVLLLNSALSVETGRTGSHTQLWKPFVSSLLTNLQKKDDGLVFVFMGNVAQQYNSCVKQENIVNCIHPSACARTGCEFPDVFREIDEKMQKNGKPLIYWI